MRSPLAVLRAHADRMRQARTEAVALADEAAVTAALHIRPGASVGYLLHTTRVPLHRLEQALHRLVGDGAAVCVRVPEDDLLGRREWTLTCKEDSHHA